MGTLMSPVTDREADRRAYTRMPPMRVFDGNGNAIADPTLKAAALTLVRELRSALYPYNQNKEHAIRRELILRFPRGLTVKTQDDKTLFTNVKSLNALSHHPTSG